MEDSPSSPPTEWYIRVQTVDHNSSTAKSTKPSHHISKRASTANSRHKRVWKACERCRMRKTKCNGEFPCKRCKDDGQVCTAGVRKKTEFKQLPRGYAEVLENTQFALIAIVQKLYSMVRNGQQWDLGEPDLNDRGQPVMHNIAQKLGCIPPNSDVFLPLHSFFPDDKQGIADLVSQLEAQQQQQDSAAKAGAAVVVEQQPQQQQSAAMMAILLQPDHSSLSEADHSDFKDYRKATFSGGDHVSSSTMTLSPASLTYDSFDSYSAPPSEGLQSATAPTNPVPPTFVLSTMAFVAMNPPPQFIQPSGSFADMNNMLNQAFLESEFGAIKPHLHSYSNPEMMVGMGDPMIQSK